MDRKKKIVMEGGRNGGAHCVSRRSEQGDLSHSKPGGNTGWGLQKEELGLVNLKICQSKTPGTHAQLPVIHKHSFQTHAE